MKNGTSSYIEVTKITSEGILLLVNEQALWVNYHDFPWLKEQTIKSILNVEVQSPGYICWPDLDVHLTEDMINNPDQYSLEVKLQGETCQWKQIDADHNDYETGCGELFSISEGTPDENELKFCFFCGKLMAQALLTE